LLNNLFAVVAAQKRIDEAEPSLRRALAISAAAGDKNPRVLRMQANLAGLEAERGRFQDSAKLYAEVIAAQERMLGPDHPQVAETLAAYSEVLRKLHQKTAAKQAEMRSNAIL